MSVVQVGDVGPSPYNLPNSNRTVSELAVEKKLLTEKIRCNNDFFLRIQFIFLAKNHACAKLEAKIR